MRVKGLWFLAVLLGLAASGVLQVNGMRVYTPGDVEAVNGTDVRLKCTFESSAKINPNTASISWIFKPLSGGRQESVFYYHQQPYPPKEGIFKKKIAWAGDLTNGDASIIIRQVKFIYNGTYVCQVTNPPDVHGTVGEIRLRVVLTASFSELLILALGIGGGIAAAVLLLVIIVSCRRCKRRQRQLEGNEEAPRREKTPLKVTKDPTECHPLRAAHLYVSQTSIEIDSSDGMISDPSTKDPSSSEEEDPSSDDDGGGDSD